MARCVLRLEPSDSTSLSVDNSSRPDAFAVVAPAKRSRIGIPEIIEAAGGNDSANVRPDLQIFGRLDDVSHVVRAQQTEGDQSAIPHRHGESRMCRWLRRNGRALNQVRGEITRELPA